jgi:HSP20 family protein
MTFRFHDPFAEIDRVMDRMFQAPPVGMMPMDVFEQEGSFVLRFDLPGIDPESVELTVEQNVLTVTVERQREETEGVNWLVRERPAGRHSRQIRLGPAVDTSAVEASYDQGVLSVTVPLREEARPYRVSIQTPTRQALTS